MREFDKTKYLDLNDSLARLQEKRSIITAMRPLPQMALNRLREDLSIEWTYNSNAIEGNTLSLNETRIVLQDGITIGGKSIREHFEVINHQKAIDYLTETVHVDYELRPIDLLNIHSLVMKNVDDDYAGRIRNGMVRISGANFTPPAPSKVSDYLDELIEYVIQNPDKLDAILLATVFHHRLVWIHPFFDGNGRTARLAMNLLLMKDGYPPAIILKNDRKKYYNALNMANKGDYQKLALMMIQASERSLNFYLNLSPEYYEDFQPLSNIAMDPEVPYGMEYLSLMARKGMINAFKEGRVWYTSKAEILRYIKK